MDALPIDYAAYATLNLGRGVAQIMLQRGRFHCPEGQKRALLIRSVPSGLGWVGCWTDDGTAFVVRWEDGDESRFPKNEIKGIPDELRGPAPTT